VIKGKTTVRHGICRKKGISKGDETGTRNRAPKKFVQNAKPISGEMIRASEYIGKNRALIKKLK